ncbi:MAG: hypothetical protein ACT4NU_01680 [Chromatiales bacterium]
MTSAIANHGETLAPLMRRAGFRYVFLGIENVLEGDLRFLRASTKNTRRESGQKAGNATIKAIECLHRHKMHVVGGLIIGNPDDTRESIEINLDFAWHYVDWPYIQHPTPYPRTPMTREFRDRGLIINEQMEDYDGTTAVVRSEHLAAEEIEFLRWRADRWMSFATCRPPSPTAPGTCCAPRSRCLDISSVAAPSCRCWDWRMNAGPSSAPPLITKSLFDPCAIGA